MILKKQRAILTKSVQGMFAPPYTGTIINRRGQLVTVIRDGRKTRETWSYRFWKVLPK
jgi:hypothetical protein